MRSWIARRTLRAFAKRYGYDVSYLQMMLNHSPSAFFKFAPVMKAAAHREAVPIEASFAAKIVGALAEDCGPCTQLVVDMALEAGMAPSIAVAGAGFLAAHALIHLVMIIGGHAHHPAFDILAIVLPSAAAFYSAFPSQGENHA